MFIYNLYFTIKKINQRGVLIKWQQRKVKRSEDKVVNQLTASSEAVFISLILQKYYKSTKK